MKVGEHVHWYIGGNKCQLDCVGCFRPISTYNQKDEIILLLAKTLAQAKYDKKKLLKKVTLTGGEPLLEKRLFDILPILKKEGIYVSIHTNGIALTSDKIKRLKGLVDDIALPIDSLDEKVQEELRGRRFLPTHRRIFEIAEQIQKNDISLGYHTLFTMINHADMPSIYEKLATHGFDYWRIYEIDNNLPQQRILHLAKFPLNEAEHKRIGMKLEKLNELSSQGSPERACTDGVLAYLLLEEEKFKQKTHDKRVKFMANYESSDDFYLFLENNGNLSIYSSEHTPFRLVYSNLLIEDLCSTVERIKHNFYTETDEPDLSKEPNFQQRWADIRFRVLPFWAVVGELTPIEDEIELTDKNYLPLANHLARLWSAREARLNKESVKKYVGGAEYGMQFVVDFKDYLDSVAQTDTG